MVLGMKCPAELNVASPRRYEGLPELTYPFHDRDILVTACGRLCLHRKRINISKALAGQKLGIMEVDEGIWLVRFMHHDLGYFDLEQRTLQPLDNPYIRASQCLLLSAIRCFPMTPSPSIGISYSTLSPGSSRRVKWPN